jgi:hypothetical protein
MLPNDMDDVREMAKFRLSTEAQADYSSTTG